MLIIAGPTASGKTDKAIEYAIKNRCYIINADALQLYKDLPTLTATPLREEMQGILHLGFGLLKPTESGDVALWYATVLDIIKTHGPNYILVGGTGFYLKAFLEGGLSEIPDIPLDIRNNVFSLNKDQLISEIIKNDPEILNKLHINDIQRLQRALCVKLATGHSIVYYQNKSSFSSPKISVHMIDLEVSVLKDRINRRVHFMMQKGAIDEVQMLLKRYPDLAQLPIARVIGVKEIVAYLNNTLSFDAMVERIQILTHQYAKRQRTFFRNQSVFVSCNRRVD